MTCELNSNVSCDECTLDYCPDMIRDALNEWYKLNNSIQYHELKINKLKYEKREWLSNHAELLRNL